MGRGRDFRRSHSRGRARRHRAWVRQLEYGDVNNSSPSTESGRGIATGFIEPRSEVSMDFSLVRVALGSDLPVFVDRVEAGLHRLLEELVLYKIEKLTVIKVDIEECCCGEGRVSIFHGYGEYRSSSENRERTSVKNGHRTTFIRKIKMSYDYLLYRLFYCNYFSNVLGLCPPC